MQKRELSKFLLYLIILEVEGHLCTPAKLLPRGITCDGEGATSLRLPHVLLIIVVLGGHNYPLSDKVGRVETDTELANHGHISTSSEGLHELLGPGPGDGPQVVDEVGLGHADAAVDDGESVGGLVRDKVDEQLRLRIQLALVREALEPDLVQCLQNSKQNTNQLRLQRNRIKRLELANRTDLDRYRKARTSSHNAQIKPHHLAMLRSNQKDT